MADPVPNFTLELQGDMKANWDYFKDTFDSYVTLMGYREEDRRKPAKELAALTFALPKETRIVLRNTIQWADDEDKTNPQLTLKKLGEYYQGTKNIIHERVEFNQMKKESEEKVNQWHTRCNEQGIRCEYCDKCTPQLIRDRFIVGIGDDQLMTKLVNSAVRNPRIPLTDIVVQAQQHEATTDRIQTISSTMSRLNEEVHYADSRKKHQSQPSRSRIKNTSKRCSWCAGPADHRKEDCPAKGKQCYGCGRLDHLKVACLHPNPKWRNQRQEVRHTTEYDEESYEFQNFSVDVKDDNTVHHSELKARARAVGRDNRYQHRRGKKYFAIIDIAVNGRNANFHKMKFQIDCGATCNIIPYSYLRQLGEITVNPTSSTMHMYSGDCVRPKGTVDLLCRKNGHQLSLPFFIVEGPNFDNKPPILSGTDCEILELITISADEIYTTDHITSPSVGKNHLSVQSIRSSYSDVFHGLGSIGEPVHIQMDPEVRPVQAGLRRYPVNKVPAISNRIREMIADGYLTAVSEPTPWCSPMTVVDRPGKKLRICMDPVRTLNKAIKRPIHPMPTLEENLHKLTHAKCFTLVDALSGFTQVKLDDESSLLTTMHSPIGRVRWLRLPFGISSAPEEFQRRQQDVLDGLDGVINVADDILVYGSGTSQEEAEKDHDKHLINLMNRCRERNLKLNPEKFKFKLKEVPFMGHRVTAEGLKVCKEKIEAITKMPTPEDKKAVLRFLGMCNFLAQFIPKLSETCSPLREISGASHEFSWSSVQQKAYDEVKAKVAHSCSLQYFDPTLPVTLQVDASDYGIGSALLQNGRPVAYSSTTLSKSERDNYAQIEKECLAIVHAMTRWDQWLYGHHNILVESDHKPLETIFKHPVTQAPKRLQKMMVKLSRYTFNIQYRKGSTMWLADTLSRAPLKRHETSIPEFEVFAADYMNTDSKPDRIEDHTFRLIQRATADDPVLSHLIPCIRHGWPTEKSHLPVELTPFWTYRCELIVIDGVIYKGHKVIVPAIMRPRMLEKIHAAHQGIEKSVMNATDTLFWPSIRSDIRTVCENCRVCAEYTRQHQKEPMKHHPIPCLPWQYVSQDLFHHGDHNYLVTVDHYSDYFEVDSLCDTLATTVVKATKKVFARHGSPMVCLTDNGPQFISRQYKDFCDLWNFRHITSSPYHSQGNGRAEAAVKAAKNLLKKCKDPLLGLLHLRNTPTKGHETSPCQRIFSRRTRTSLPVAESLLKPSNTSSQSVQDEIEEIRHHAKQSYDKSAGPELPELALGQKVYIRPPPTQHGKPWQHGQVIEKPAPRSYVVKTEGQSVARRNRCHLRASTTTMQPNLRPQEYVPSSDAPIEASTGVMHSPPVAVNRDNASYAAGNPVLSDAEPYKTRSGRVSKAPEKYE